MECIRGCKRVAYGDISSENVSGRFHLSFDLWVSFGFGWRGVFVGCETMSEWVRTLHIQRKIQADMSIHTHHSSYNSMYNNSM